MWVKLCLLLTFLVAARGKSDALGYDAVLAIVIAELAFAFSIGLVCIIFSFNLFRALKDSGEEYSDLPIGDLPRSRSTTLATAVAASRAASRSNSAHNIAALVARAKVDSTAGLSDATDLNAERPSHDNYNTFPGVGDFGPISPDDPAAVGSSYSFFNDLEMNDEDLALDPDHDRDGEEHDPSTFTGVLYTFLSYLRPL